MKTQDEIRRSRMRWHCRRALLELDIVLARFLETRFATLDAEELSALEELLAYEDTELWPIVSGRRECDQAHLRRMVDMLRATKDAA